MPSFDVVSKLDAHELDNAVGQAKKELVTRYDFQGTKTDLDFTPDRNGIQLKSSTQDRIDVAYEILLAKMVKRGVPIRGVSGGEVEQAALGQVKRLVTLQQGIPVEKAKELIKALKDSKLKVQGSIQGDQLRVSGKSRDELQGAIAFLRGLQDTVKLDLQFTNFRE
jgi:uncharacterized protein YajQ (UPF0234 family)